MKFPFVEWLYPDVYRAARGSPAGAAPLKTTGVHLYV